MSTSRVVPFWCAVGVLLAVMAALQFTTARQESQTFDEGRQLLSGYTYLTTGHFTVAREHPPLLKLLWAIPVAFLHPSPPPGGDPWIAAAHFLYHNRVPADNMLLAGRCSAIAVSVLLGWAIAFWAKLHFGVPAALLAVFLYAADPNFLANGRYIKNDVGAALAIFAATMVWGGYLLDPTRRRLWLAGLVVGLALCTKSSALILGPVLLLLYAVRRWQQRRNFGAWECIRSLGTVGIIAFFVILLVYRFDTEPAGVSAEISRRFPAASWLARIPVPAMAYFQGLGTDFLKQTVEAQEYKYLLGKQSATGWWYMSPVALAVKTPLAELALFALAMGLAARRLRTVRLREIGFRWFLMLLPPVCYFAATLFSDANSGERHLLPIYPFLFVFAAGLLLQTPLSKWRLAAASGLGALLVLETASVHPHYLAFFNALAGGPAGGRQYLVDSNLDWGQDAKNLKAYLDAHHIPEACVAYNGRADLEYYGIRRRPLPELPNVEMTDRLDCVAAISVTYLAIFRDAYAGLDELQPDARIGYSIYVYDLRKGRAITH